MLLDITPLPLVFSLSNDKSRVCSGKREDWTAQRLLPANRSGLENTAHLQGYQAPNAEASSADSATGGGEGLKVGERDCVDGSSC